MRTSTYSHLTTERDAPASFAIGIDNGVSGTVGIVSIMACHYFSPVFFSVPTFKEFAHTKVAKRVSRIDITKLSQMITCMLRASIGSIRIVMEGPMKNPGRFQATISAFRAFEAELIMIEKMLPPLLPGVPISLRIIPSRTWQKDLLPNVKTAPLLKAASMQVGIQLFPGLREPIQKHKDADGLLIAEWARRNA